MGCARVPENSTSFSGEELGTRVRARPIEFILIEGKEIRLIITGQLVYGISVRGRGKFECGPDAFQPRNYSYIMTKINVESALLCMLFRNYQFIVSISAI